MYWSKFCKLALILLLPSYVPVRCLAQSLIRLPHAKEYLPGQNLISHQDTVSILKRLQLATAIFEQYPDSASAIASAGFQQSLPLKFNKGLAIGSILQGRIAQNSGQYDSSIFFFTRGIIYAKIGSLTTSSFYINIANSYFFKGAYQTALENYHLALKQRGLPPGDSSQTYLNIALVWERIGAIDQAKFYLRIVEDIATRNHDTLMLIGLLHQRASIAIGEQQISLGIDQLEMALALAKRNNQEGAMISLFNTLTHLYLDQKRVDKAMMYTNEALAIFKRYPGAYNFEYYHARHNLGLIYSYLKNYKYAEQLLYQTFSIAEATGLKDLILHMETDLAAVYAKNGKNGLAYKHMLHYAQLKDSILEQERKSMLTLWQKNIVTEKDKSLLTQKLQITQQQKRLQFKNIWIGTTLAGTALLCMGFATWLRSYRRKQRLQQELILRMKQAVQIDQLKAQVKGEEQERNRLALELHDGIASQLWAIKLNVESVQQNLHHEDKEKLDFIYQQLEETTQEVRKTAHNLMPDLLLQYGLTSALESLSSKLKSSAALDVAFQEYGVIPRMNEDIELSLYRMIQELIQNVLKHAAGVTQLLIQLSCTEDLLNITIEDNGSGFSPEEMDRKGIGLSNIAQRVKTLRGHLDIKSVQGKGTTVYLEFEIQHLL